MTTVLYYLGDSYETTFTLTGVTSIIKYHHGLNGHGELVDFDTLTPPLQTKIYKKLKQELDYAKRKQKTDRTYDASI